MSNHRLDIRYPYCSEHQQSNANSKSLTVRLTFTPTFTTLLQIKCTTFRKLDLQPIVCESLCSDRISIHSKRENWEWKDWSWARHVTQLLLIIGLSERLYYGESKRLRAGVPTKCQMSLAHLSQITSEYQQNSLQKILMI